ncbi:hypothetical protein [Methanogenium cariaci]|jgi:hypothetical protein
MEPGPADVGHGQAVGRGVACLREQSHQNRERQPDHRKQCRLHLPISLVWEGDSLLAVAEEPVAAGAVVDAAVDLDADNRNQNNRECDFPKNRILQRTGLLISHPFYCQTNSI